MSNVTIIGPDESDPSRRKPRGKAIAIPTPMEMLDRALVEGKPLEIVKELMDLQDRYEKTEARKAFDEAIAAAKAEIKPVVKNREGHNKKKYADIAAIADAVDPIISKFGLSYRHSSTQTDRISVTCKLSHKLGYFEETTLSAQPDATGSKNEIQALGSTLTYLQRYTLVLALGLSSAEHDDDGRGAGRVNDGPITPEQAEQIQLFIVQRNFKIKPFCNVMKVPSIADIPASRFAEAMKLLQDKADEEDRVAGKKP